MLYRMEDYRNKDTVGIRQRTFPKRQICSIKGPAGKRYRVAKQLISLLHKGEVDEAGAKEWVATAMA